MIILASKGKCKISLINSFFQAESSLYLQTAVVTGGSRGLGLEVARQLAAKGAHVVIVARHQDSLDSGIKLMQARILSSFPFILSLIWSVQQSALNTDRQRFHSITADLISPSESVRAVAEVKAWNSGKPPDIVWCCAGGTHPTLFIDTPSLQFKE
ncbi:hypothetical protein RRF57_002359 [Xylaria bambusicola]|uniref:Uncharacterized protein n=1 Tax=Xylaria bambusicola TaxID=326684 RepID=A0AAN7USQ1_9PEZI